MAEQLTLRRNIDRKLTVQEMDNNFIYLDRAAAFLSLTVKADNSYQVDEGYNTYRYDLGSDAIDTFVFAKPNINMWLHIYLPDPTTVFGSRYSFIKNDSNYENGATVYGDFVGGETNYMLSTGSLVRFISDGLVWRPA